MQTYGDFNDFTPDIWNSHIGFYINLNDFKNLRLVSKNFFQIYCRFMRAFIVSINYIYLDEIALYYNTSRYDFSIIESVTITNGSINGNLNDIFRKIIKYENIKVAQFGSLKIERNHFSIFRDIFDRDIKNIFITGGAGVGKSYIINKLVELFEFVDCQYLLSASTGIAAVNIKGLTINSLLGLGLANQELGEIIQNACFNKNRRFQNKLIRNAAFLVIDEISMISTRLFTLIDVICRKLRYQENTPFGGLKLICVGDFFQLPPIEDQKDNKLTFPFLRDVEINRMTSLKYCFQSPSWIEADFHVIELKEIYRQNDAKFKQILNEIRIGSISSESLKVLDTKMILHKENAFPLLDNSILNRDWVNLYARNIDVDQENLNCLKLLKDKEYKYTGKGKVEDIHKKNAKDGPSSFEVSRMGDNCLNNIKKNCLVPETLILKKGCRVMLLKNLEIERGLCNGSSGTIIDFIVDEEDDFDAKTMHLPLVLFDNGRKKLIKPHKWITTIQDVFRVEYEHIPLRLFYGMTIHKVQGQTFSKALVDLQGVFTHGQVYVALSRLVSLKGLALYGFNPRSIIVHDVVKNFYSNGCKNPDSLVKKLENYSTSLVIPSMYENNTNNKRKKI